MRISHLHALLAAILSAVLVTAPFGYADDVNPSPGPNPLPIPIPKPEDPTFVPGEVLVLPREGKSVDVARLIEDQNLKLQKIDPYSGLMTVGVPAGNEEEWAKWFAGRAVVEYSETNLYDLAHMTPNDSFYNEQWHLNNVGQSGGTAGADIEAEEAWDLTTGSANIVVAVIDTGLDQDHPDFAGRIDNRGRDFVNEDNNPEDDHGHGTNVAGCIAARTNNTFGVSGVDWACRILPIKAGRPSPTTGRALFSHADIAQALNYLAGLGNVEIVNMSFGGQNSATKQNAITAASNAGLILIASAGNGGVGTADGNFPAASPEVISIGATTRNDARAGFSSTGSTVDFVAPGQAVTTARFNNNNNGRQSVNGTSFAAPITAGVAALILAQAEADGRTLDQDAVYSTLQLGAEDEVGPPGEDTPGEDNFFGLGRINANVSVGGTACAAVVASLLASREHPQDRMLADASRRRESIDEARRFRDGVVKQSVDGRTLVALYYRQGAEVKQIMREHPELAVRAARFIFETQNELRAANSAGSQLEIDRETFIAGMAILDDFDAHASDELHEAIGSLRRFVAARMTQGERSVSIDFRDVPATELTAQPIAWKTPAAATLLALVSLGLLWQRRRR